MFNNINFLLQNVGNTVFTNIIGIPLEIGILMNQSGIFDISTEENFYNGYTVPIICLQNI